MIIKGTEIQRLATIGSRYANGYLQVYINGIEHRIHVSEILKMVNEFDFEVRFAKQYNHLENPRLVRKCVKRNHKK